MTVLIPAAGSLPCGWPGTDVLRSSGRAFSFGETVLVGSLRLVAASSIAFGVGLKTGTQALVGLRLTSKTKYTASEPMDPPATRCGGACVSFGYIVTVKMQRLLATRNTGSLTKMFLARIISSSLSLGELSRMPLLKSERFVAL